MSTKNTPSRNAEIAETIRLQLGGNTLFMLGAKNLFAVENGLYFKISGSRNVSHIAITINSTDTYDVTFLKLRGLNVKTVAVHKDICVENLHQLIESETGLYSKV